MRKVSLIAATRKRKWSVVGGGEVKVRGYEGGGHDGIPVGSTDGAVREGTTNRRARDLKMSSSLMVSSSSGLHAFLLTLTRRNGITLWLLCILLFFFLLDSSFFLWLIVFSVGCEWWVTFICIFLFFIFILIFSVCSFFISLSLSFLLIFSRILLVLIICYSQYWFLTFCSYSYLFLLLILNYFLLYTIFWLFFSYCFIHFLF